MSPRRGQTFEDVRRIALALPGVEDGVSYGAPALKVNGNLLIRLRDDLGAIVVKTTLPNATNWSKKIQKPIFSPSTTSRTSGCSCVSRR